MKIQQISQREKEVLRLISYEYTTQEIAARLYISANTVMSHRKRLLSKLSVSNTAGMMRRGFEYGLLQLAD